MDLSYDVPLLGKLKPGNFKLKSIPAYQGIILIGSTEHAEKAELILEVEPPSFTIYNPEEGHNLQVAEALGDEGGDIRSVLGPIAKLALTRTSEGLYLVEPDDELIIRSSEGLHLFLFQVAIAGASVQGINLID